MANSVAPDHASDASDQGPLFAQAFWSEYMGK